MIIGDITLEILLDYIGRRWVTTQKMLGVMDLQVVERILEIAVLEFTQTTMRIHILLPDEAPSDILQSLILPCKQQECFITGLNPTC